MRKILVCCSVIGMFAVTSTSAYAWDSGGGNGHNKQAVCHKPGTPAEHTLYLPSPAVQAHLNHGDYLGECKPGTSTPPPPNPGPCANKPGCRCITTPCGTPPPPPAPTPAPAPSTSNSNSSSSSTSTTTTTVNVNVNVQSSAPAPAACPCTPPVVVKPHRKHCRTITVVRYRKVWHRGRDCCGHSVRWYTYKKVHRKRRICV